MSNYPNTTLTNAGQDLIAESIAEGKALIFTKVELGDGNLTAGQSISTLTALISSKMNVPLSSGSADNGQAKLRFAVGNSGLEEGFFAREVGVFAKAGADGVETLYAYTNGGNYVDFIPDQSRPIDDQIMDVYIVTGNAAEVQIQVDSAAYLTVSDLTEHNDDAESHKDVYGRFIRQRQADYELKDVVYLPSLGAKFYLECTTPGTTPNTDLTVTSPAVGNTVTDGAVVWTIRKLLNPTDIPDSTAPGTIMAFAGNSTPSGFLLCDGSAVSRTTYSKLYAAIGTTWGSGNGSTTFSLPNLNGYWLKGSSTAGSSVNAGLPNITGQVGSSFTTDISGAFTLVQTQKDLGSGTVGSRGYASFSASSSNSLYGASSTVSVSSKTVRFIIKY